MDWISMDDRLPPTFESVLICVRERDTAEVDFGYLDERGNWTIFNDFDIGHEITHWMKLPAPPTENRTE